MTTLSIRKANKEDLQAYIDAELACYAIRVDGVDIDVSAEPNSRGDFPRKHFLGAIERIAERTLIGAMAALQQRQEQGYKLFLDTVLTPSVGTNGVTTLYVTKPEAIQAEEKAKVIAEVTAKYATDIDAHNEKVFAQEAEALKAEEAAVAAQLRAEDEQRAQADFDKRVRARMKGAK
ncbi:hypothetical protein [Pseudomonas palleroniana]